MRRLATTCALLATCALLLLLSLGFWGQSAGQRARAEMSDQAVAAEKLMQLEQAAAKENQASLEKIVSNTLSQLPPTARSVADGQGRDVLDLESALADATDNLVTTAFSAKDGATRYFLFTSANEIWDAGRTAKVAEGSYTPELAEHIAAQGTCQPTDSPQSAPESLQAVMTVLNELAYASSFYSARADVDGYDSALTERLNKLNDRADSWRQTSNDEFSCVYELPPRPANFPLNQNEAEQTTDLLLAQLSQQVDAALADSSITDEVTLTQLLVLREQLT